MIPKAIYIFILIELAVVSWGDIKTRKIPNLWAILNIVCFLVFVFLFKEHYHFKLQTFLYSFVFLGVGFLLFVLNIMGGGDSKFLFSFFLLIPEFLQDKAMNYLLISTVGIGSIIFLINTFRNRQRILEYLKAKKYKDLKKCFGSKFSFAPVIFVSWIVLGIQEKIFF